MIPIYNLTLWTNVTDPDLLKTSIESSLSISGFGILNQIDKHFNNNEWSSVWLLSESHISVHVVNEYSFIQLSSSVFSCFSKFILIIKDLLPVIGYPMITRSSPEKTISTEIDLNLG